MPPHRSRRSSLPPAGVLAVCAIFVVTFNGCGRPPASAVSFLTGGRQGHAYVARLVNEHPLYDQYQRLEQELAFLRRPCAAPPVSPVTLELGELFLPPPEPPRFPLERFAARKSAWEQGLLTGPLDGTVALAPDLSGELEWRQRQMRRAASRQLEAIRAREEAVVATARARAVRERQEALNNLGLDLNPDETQRQATEDAERKRLWAEIEAETGAARRAAEGRVARAEEQVNAELTRSLAAVAADVARRMEKRTETFVKSGSEMRAAMSKAIMPPDPPAAGAGLSWQPTAVPSAQGFQPTLQPLLAADRQARARQAMRLAAARAEVGREIFEATALAIKRLGGPGRTRIALPPEEPAVGRDMTEGLRPQLRQMFHPDQI